MQRPRFAIAAIAALAAIAAGAPTAAAVGRCGTHPWCDTSLPPDQRAGLLLSALTQDERISLLAGDPANAGVHTGIQDGVARVDLPPTYYSDGPVGPRQGPATAMPIPMALAATFDPRLAYAHGATIANEARAKGNDVLFAPTVNIMRTPLGGRSFEGYGEDPYLVTRTAVNWIEGAQGQGVIGDVKHFAANNQEGASPDANSSSPSQPLGGGIFGVRYLDNVIVDERTLREIYLPQFEAAVREARVGSVMCSYNLLRGQYACENTHLLQQVLRREWGFNGYTIADYGAAHNTVDSLNNGLDFEPWPAVAYASTPVKAALASGLVGAATIDEHARNMLRTLFAFGFFDRPAYRNDDSQIDKQAHAQTAQHIEENAVALLENRGALPLSTSRLRSIAVIGPAADKFVTGGGSGAVTPFSAVTVREGIAARAGPNVKVNYDDGSNAAQALADAKASDVAVVVVGDYETEGVDRACLTLECPNGNGNQDALIEQVAAANPNTIVVLETGAPVLTPWRDRVRGLLEAWYPGEQGGTAVARVLFGDVDPGGRLPATFPQQESDEPTAGDPQTYPGDAQNNTYYKEGVLVGYRWFDAHGLAPAFPFGFGLSYTTWRYRNLHVGATPGAPGATVTFDVANTGTRAGSDVPQLYLGMPAPSAAVMQPPRQLKGYQKIAIAPGETAHLRLTLDARALSYWDTATGAWRIAPGCYRVMVGDSSRDIALASVLPEGGATCPAATPPAGPVACASHRSVLVHLLHLRASGVRRVRVYLNGRLWRTFPGPRSSVRVVLSGRPRQVVRVRLVVTRVHGGDVTVRRTYRTCTAPRRHRLRGRTPRRGRPRGG